MASFMMNIVEWRSIFATSLINPPLIPDLNMCEDVVENWMEDMVADIVSPFLCLLSKIRDVNPEVERRLRDVISPKGCAHWEQLIRDFVKENFSNKYDRDVWRTLVGKLNADGSKKNSVILVALYWYLAHRLNIEIRNVVQKDIRLACESRFSENCLFHDAYSKLASLLDQTI